MHLYYGPSRNRYQRIDDLNQSGETTTHYVAGIEKIWRPNKQLMCGMMNTLPTMNVAMYSNLKSKESCLKAGLYLKSPKRK